jgi:hypothetical protein
MVLSRENATIIREAAHAGQFLSGTVRRSAGKIIFDTMMQCTRSCVLSA